jgi:hypothetical protein
MSIMDHHPPALSTPREMHRGYVEVSYDNGCWSEKVGSAGGEGRR